jgi:hypothetical protein
MKSSTRRAFFGGLLVCLACFSALPTHAQNPQQGANAVWTSGIPSGSPVPSYTFVDATQFSGNSLDFCAQINSALSFVQNHSNLFPSGAVVDARGVFTSGCSSDPFNNITVGSTLLLPPRIIMIQHMWTMPNNTRIVGESQVVVSTLQAKGLTGDMIEMGSSTLCTTSSPCSGISIEHLTLDGQTENVNGIHNFAQDQSYVNDVNFVGMASTGLVVDTGAAGSGPYSNINYVATGTTCNASQCPACVLIQAQTRGLHGISCVGDLATLPTAGAKHAGIYVDASNNSIEDVHVESFWDGVEIGHNSSTVAGVVVANVNGGINDRPVQNLIHICGNNPPSGGITCSSPGTVTDVTILQVTLQTAPNTSTTVEDDVTASVIAAPSTGPPQSVGMYVLGAAIAGTGGYSRLTSSPIDPSTNSINTVVPAWGVGTQMAPTGRCSKPGALYSNTTGGSSTPSVYVCTGSNGWRQIV